MFWHHNFLEMTESEGIHTWRVGTEKMEPFSSLWCTVIGQEAMGTTWNTESSLCTPGNTFLLWAWLSTGTGFSGRLLDIFEIHSHKSGQMTLDVSARAWTRWPPKVPSNLNYSVFLQLCDYLSGIQKESVSDIL